MQFDSANEVWSARGSLVTTDPLGMTDVPIPDNVRIYQFAGTQHQAGTGDDPPAERGGNCQQVSNPAPSREAQRALLVAMQTWVTRGTSPPASQYSKLADGTLVPGVAAGGAGIPGDSWGALHGQTERSLRQRLQRAAGSTCWRAIHRVGPEGDKDGNNLGGVRASIIQVPIGTYQGGDLRKAGFVENEGCGTNGSVHPVRKEEGGSWRRSSSLAGGAIRNP